MKRWIRRGAKLLGGVVLVLVGFTLVWWFRQPHLIEDHTALHAGGGSAEYSAAMEASEAWATAIADSLDLPSLSLAASVDGEVVWFATLGYQDMHEGIPAGPGTLYRTGSVAKAITSVVLGRAVDDGRIDLDRTAGSYLGEAAGDGGEATLRQLAGHQGGVRHYTLDQPGTVWKEQFSQRHFEAARDALVLFAEDPLVFEPGSGFGYSTHGYTLLSAALEAGTGTAFTDLLAASVTAPLGLDATGPDDVREKSPERAIPYVRVRERFVDPFQVDPSFKWAGGGLLSTPIDLVTMAGALMTGDFLTQETRRALWTPQPLPDGSPNPQNYGMGWRIEPVTEALGTGQEMLTVHHGGSIVGGSSILLLLPDQRVAVAGMTNLSLIGDDGSRLRAAVYRMAGAFTEAR